MQQFKNLPFKLRTKSTDKVQKINQELEQSQILRAAIIEQKQSTQEIRQKYVFFLRNNQPNPSLNVLHRGKKIYYSYVRSHHLFGITKVGKKYIRSHSMYHIYRVKFFRNYPIYIKQGQKTFQCLSSPPKQHITPLHDTQQFFNNLIS